MSEFDLLNSKCLISGTSSGIGMFLKEKLPSAESFDRTISISNYKKKSYDAIIHCAYDSGSVKGHKNIYEQSRSNIYLVEKLCEINTKVFIFFSSIDVYPKKFKGSQPDYRTGSEDLLNRHAFFKIVGESIVASKVKNHFIFRPSLMIGKNARINTLVNIVKGKKGPFTLAKNSRFNLITHDQVLFCIQAALTANKKRVINLCSGLEVSLDEIARHVGNNNIQWGQHEYITPKIENSNAIQFFGADDIKINELVSMILSW